MFSNHPLSYADVLHHGFRAPPSRIRRLRLPNVEDPPIDTRHIDDVGPNPLPVPRLTRHQATSSCLDAARVSSQWTALYLLQRLKVRFPKGQRSISDAHSFAMRNISKSNIRTSKSVQGNTTRDIRNWELADVMRLVNAVRFVLYAMFITCPAPCYKIAPSNCGIYFQLRRSRRVSGEVQNVYCFTKDKRT